MWACEDAIFLTSYSFFMSLNNHVAENYRSVLNRCVAKHSNLSEYLYSFSLCFNGLVVLINA